MNQLYHIIRREILVKLKSRSFYLFAMITPFLFVLPLVSTVFSSSPKSQQLSSKVGVICRDFPYDSIEYRGIKFFALDARKVREVRDGSFCYDGYIGVVDMKELSFFQQHDALQIKLYSPDERAELASKRIHDIESFINSEYVYRYGRLHELANNELLKVTNFAKVSVVYGHSSTNHFEANKAKMVAFGLGLLLYIMFILFNNNIVKSVSEEKTNKLAEVLSMFVKPGKLMLGKIFGLAIASLVQLMVWLLAFTLYTKMALALGQHLHYIDDGANVASVDFSSLLFSGHMLGWLIAFFILGFLLNGSLSTIFAICSSSRGSSVPMVLSNMFNLLAIYFCMYAATNPGSNATIFASYCPLTSYLVIPAILPYGMPFSHIVVSALLLIVVSLFFLYLSGRLYRKFLV